MKVYFDIITNHTADVIGYERGRPHGRTSRRTPCRTRTRDRAARSTTATTPAPARFPALDPPTSFPYTPGARPRRARTSRSPAWLNDVTLYHNRGDTTFTGED